ncbi:dioxygenase family protein [Celeribacter litoreus]|uniref:dioxygenase family protein n=1 Tax=Celeribacter litoreus TaxID=2876714 RepID=UPI001CCCCC9B|nr:hypothetical protein [Celeribacter litoreus]MCA0045225.1 hypothetical protein [Celeribacter litoreus]
MPHSDDHGFQHDLPNLLGRRRFMGLFGGLGVAVGSGLPAAALDCVAVPRETAGPFPADGTNRKDGQIVDILRQEGVIRRDITTSFGPYSGTAGGSKVTLDIELQDYPGCMPLAGAAIYIWHCDADGAYSMYNVAGANWLRGLGVADENGVVTFETTVPGCYRGRWPHIHFEVFENVEAAISGARPMLTSQIALPEAEIGDIYEAYGTVYARSIQNLANIPLERDGIFRNNSAEELKQQTMTLTEGAVGEISGRVTIPVA